jgi:hypothetical protein
MLRAPSGLLANNKLCPKPFARDIKRVTGRENPGRPDFAAAFSFLHALDELLFSFKLRPSPHPEVVVQYAILISAEDSCLPSYNARIRKECVTNRYIRDENRSGELKPSNLLDVRASIDYLEHAICAHQVGNRLHRGSPSEIGVQSECNDGSPEGVLFDLPNAYEFAIAVERSVFPQTFEIHRPPVYFLNESICLIA